MDEWQVFPSSLSGEISLPSSKSQSIRAIIFALLGKGKSTITNLLPSPDVEAMLTACKILGGQVERISYDVEIDGVNGRIESAEDVVNAQNSGLILRFVGGIASLCSFPIVITGDDSIRHRRPVAPLLEALSQLGVRAISTRGDGGAPIIIQGPIRSGRLKICGKDSQPVSGMLIASAFAPGPIEIFVTEAGEKPWIDLTLDWFKRLGIRHTRKGYDYYRLEGGSSYAGFSYHVPSDLSSLAFPLAAALITDSDLVLKNVDLEEIQGDKRIIDILKEMGANIEIDSMQKRVVVKKGSPLKGMRVDINDCIDTLPILAVVGCHAKGKMEIVGAEIARKKESDRIHSIAHELQKMGGKIEERSDGLIIYPSDLKGTHLETYGDHRIAMSLTVAALASTGKSLIRGVSCVAKSYPTFDGCFKKIGAKIL